jgi:hypothetical protein
METMETGRDRVVMSTFNQRTLDLGRPLEPKNKVMSAKRGHISKTSICFKIFAQSKKWSQTHWD